MESETEDKAPETKEMALEQSRAMVKDFCFTTGRVFLLFGLVEILDLILWGLGYSDGSISRWVNGATDGSQA